MKKHIILFVLALSLLSACSLPGTSTESAQTSDFTEIKNEQFSLKVPAKWNEAKKQSLPAPREGSLVLAYTSPDAKNGFYNNIIILTNKIQGIMTSKQYAELNNLQTTKYYLEYTKLKEEALTFSDGDESKVYTFEAKYNQSTPRMKFLQTAKVCSGDVYLLHISLSLDRDPSLYLPILSSFSCK